MFSVLFGEIIELPAVRECVRRLFIPVRVECDYWYCIIVYRLYNTIISFYTHGIAQAHVCSAV